MSRKLMQRSNVDLPPPLGPMKKLTSPARICRSMPLSTLTAPNDFSSAGTSRMDAEGFALPFRSGFKIGLRASRAGLACGNLNRHALAAAVYRGELLLDPSHAASGSKAHREVDDRHHQIDLHAHEGIGDHNRAV